MPTAPQNWSTPPDIFNQLQSKVQYYWPASYGAGAFSAFHFDLACDAMNAKAPMLNAGAFASGYDTLQVPWNQTVKYGGDGGFRLRPATYWCNPPWNNVAAFTNKAITDQAKVCFLLPSRTDQKWFRPLAQIAVIEWFEGRVAFVDPLLPAAYARTTPREGALVAWTFPDHLEPGPSRTFRHNKTGAAIHDAPKGPS